MSRRISHSLIQPIMFDTITLQEKKHRIGQPEAEDFYTTNPDRRTVRTWRRGYHRAQE